MPWHFPATKAPLPAPTAASPFPRGRRSSAPVSTERASETVPISSSAAGIIYTQTDEAPLLATYSFLPIISGVRRPGRGPGRDARHLPGRPDHRGVRRRLPEDQRTSDALAELGDLAKPPEANIIKLPNVSASDPQLKAAIAELQRQGYDLPAYPTSPKTDDERDDRARTTRSRAARSTRCCARATRPPRTRVGQAVRPQTPALMGAWSRRLADHVAHDGRRDFRPTRSPS